MTFEDVTPIYDGTKIKNKDLTPIPFLRKFLYYRRRDNHPPG
jgi:hypothetical protein